MGTVLTQEETETSLLKIDQKQEEAIRQLKRERSFLWSFTVFSNEDTSLASHVIHYTLGLYGLNFLSNVVMLLLREMIGNAVKANLKRAFLHHSRKISIIKKIISLAWKCFKEKDWIDLTYTAISWTILVSK